MDSAFASYRRFTYQEAEEWGENIFSDWLLKLQDQNYDPKTPVEKFFRFYTQGNGDRLNNIPRRYGIENYNFDEGLFTKEMFVNSIAEIKSHPISEDIVVYRYIDKCLFKAMKEWGGLWFVKNSSILIDMGFLSTSLSIEAVKQHQYNKYGKECYLFTIFVPKGTPCVYVDLISDMHEQEMLFAPGIKLKVVSHRMFSNFFECVIC